MLTRNLTLYIFLILFGIISCEDPVTKPNDNDKVPFVSAFDYFTFSSTSVSSNNANRNCEILTAVSGTDSLSEYGGWLKINLVGSGFFRTEMYENHWWLVDPDGYLFISAGLNTFAPNEIGDSPAKMAQKFGDITGWAELESENMRRAGWNTLGAWSDWEEVRKVSQPVPYTRRWNFLATYDKARPGAAWTFTGVLPVFDVAFPTFCNQHASQLAATKDDPWLIGHFSDNELSFYANSTYGGVLERYLNQTITDESYIYANQWMIDRKGENYQNNITNTDELDFQEHVVETYYRIVGEAIKRYDPNHLFLGTRFHGAAKDVAGVARAAGKYADVISYNYYGYWEPSTSHMNMWLNDGGKPFIVSEFYVKGDDTGMDNSSGAGWSVPTQTDRGYFYQNWTMKLLKNPGAVGWHWHRYQDYDDGTDSNKGVVDNDFEWHPEVKAATALIGKRMYSLKMYLNGN